MGGRTPGLPREGLHEQRVWKESYQILSSINPTAADLCTRLLSTLAGQAQQVGVRSSTRDPDQGRLLIPWRAHLEVGEDSTGVRLRQREVGVAQGPAEVDLSDSLAVALAPEQDGRLAQPAREVRRSCHSTGVELRAKLANSRSGICFGIYSGHRGGVEGECTGGKKQYQCLDRTTGSLEDDRLLRETGKFVCVVASVALVEGR